MSLVSLSRGALAAALVLGTVATASAQQPNGAVPVIVVLNDNAPFAAFRGNYHADERMAADPEAWGYQDRGVVGAIQSLEARHGFRADHAFSAAIRGFSGRLTPQQIAALRNEGIVQSIELDGEMAIVGQRPPRDNKRPGGGGGGGGSTEVTPWGITRIGAAGKLSVTTVRAYVIDTGIDSGNADLHVVKSVNFAGGQSSDCNGHGTHVAGTIAAIHNTSGVVGVAPNAPLVSVKVLGCAGSGSTSGVIAGVDWVRANASKPAVANMSLGGSASQALDDAVRNAAASGVVFAIAAGNSGADACSSSPARAGGTNGVITTAATDQADDEASWSNYGTCVDIWAPGVNIVSTKLGGGTTTMSGTSMASPHVAGTAARYLALHPSATPADVEAGLESDALTPGTFSKDGRAIELVNAGSY
jgi:serine protease